MEITTEGEGALPSNVPRNRIVDFDIYDFIINDGDYARTLKGLTSAGLPELLWTPRKGGYWIATRSAGIESILNDHQHFSSAVAGPLKKVEEKEHQGKCPISFRRVLGLKRRDNSMLATGPLVPLQLDPPEHAKYRKIIGDAFSRDELAPVLKGTRAFAIEVIEGFMKKGKCEFLRDFAHQIPVDNFLRLLDLPSSDRKFLVRVVGQYMHGDKKTTEKASQKLVEYGLQKIRERRGTSGSDLISTIARTKIDGEELNDHIVAGMMRLILLAGFDTVASMLGFFAHFLAQNPAHRHELIEHPERIPNAVEELLRRFANVMLSRQVKVETEYAGVTLRKGDRVALPTALVGLDDRVTANPLAVVFTRYRPYHGAFGDGPHRCIGAFLAREELRIFLEEWLTRIPNFAVKPGVRVKVITNGPLATIVSLPLCWDSTSFLNVS